MIFLSYASYFVSVSPDHRLQVLAIEELVAEAVEAHKNGEIEEVEVCRPKLYREYLKYQVLFHCKLLQQI